MKRLKSFLSSTIAVLLMTIITLVVTISSILYFPISFIKKQIGKKGNSDQEDV